MLVAACRKPEPAPAIVRIALLPIENQSGDADLDWVGPAFAAMLADQASASPTAHVLQADSRDAARLASAHQFVEGYLARTAGRLRIHLAFEDATTHRTFRTLAMEAEPGSSFQDATAATARALAGTVRPPATTNATAIREWGRSFVAADAAARAAALERAVAADPAFAPAYLELARLQLAAGNRAAAAAAVSRASERAAQLRDVDQVRVRALAAELSNDANGRVAAVAELAKLVPANTALLATAAGAFVNLRQYPAAIDALRRMLAVQPGETGMWNELGYAEALNGSTENARDAIARYQTLAPQDPNAFDSMGEVLFYGGQFAEAEKQFVEAAKLRQAPVSAAELIKAAQARWLAGDQKGADLLYQQFETTAGASEPMLAIRKAEWSYVTGRAAEAKAAAANAAAGHNPLISTYAAWHLALWAMSDGDRQTAAKWVAAAGRANDRNAQNMNAFFGSVLGPQGPYAPLFARDFAEAAKRFDAAYQRSQPTADGDTRTMLAVALAGAGKQEESRRLLTRYFLPLGAGGEPMLLTHAFREFVRLRGASGR